MRSDACSRRTSASTAFARSGGSCSARASMSPSCRHSSVTGFPIADFDRFVDLLPQSGEVIQTKIKGKFCTAL